VFGRTPVLEALRDGRLDVDKIVVATDAGRSVSDVVAEARRRGVRVEHASPTRVKYLAGNGRHDQGIVADVVAPRMRPLPDWLDGVRGRSAVFVLDGVTNPANVGMILRTATAAGLDGVVVPRAGSPRIGPLVIKAPAGVALSAPILTTGPAAEAVTALRGYGFTCYGLAARAQVSLFEADLSDRSALVLGGESSGLSVEVDVPVSIPMRGGVE